MNCTENDGVSAVERGISGGGVHEGKRRRTFLEVSRARQTVLYLMNALPSALTIELANLATERALETEEGRGALAAILDRMRRREQPWLYD